MLPEKHTQKQFDDSDHDLDDCIVKFVNVESEFATAAPLLPLLLFSVVYFDSVKPPRPVTPARC